ncbi:sulfatase-like hydrolase/transferase, partial [Helicobacter sp. MIT 21-1697]|uniref:sulfatase-like hydrolase/transferase n=1 Tax=Helicobacter sp. MIT 21-1697 TaxID=2993733 RepID=UPI00224A8FD8
SSQATTFASLSQALTFFNQDYALTTPQNQWYEYLNIIDAFKLGGYHTRAISNQEPVSLFGNAAATILKRADESVFVNDSDSFDLAKHDEAILQVLYTIPPPPLPHFTALHLMGSHNRYESRYPKEFAYFKADSVQGTFNGADTSQIAAYLNSLLYNDFILS